MADEPDFPTIDQHLPDLMAFAGSLARDYDSGELSSWQALTQRVDAFFSPAMLDQVENVAPGWRQMAAQGKGLTQVHVMCTLVGLLTCPEFKRASPSQQELAKWIVLFHDIAKQVEPGKPDRIHAFRSATNAAAALPTIGFAVTADHASHCDEWRALVHAASIQLGDRHTAYPIQDNGQLPGIIEGIAQLFGHGSPAALIIETVLLLHSITMLEQYPVAAPLSEYETERYLDRDLLAQLKLMSLADSDGWELFLPSTRERYRQLTLAVFDKLESRERKPWSESTF
jgi:hypothetical protein